MVSLRYECETKEKHFRDSATAGFAGDFRCEERRRTKIGSLNDKGQIEEEIYYSEPPEEAQHFVTLSFPLCEARSPRRARGRLMTLTRLRESDNRLAADAERELGSKELALNVSGAQ